MVDRLVPEPVRDYWSWYFKVDSTPFSDFNRRANDAYTTIAKVKEFAPNRPVRVKLVTIGTIYKKGTVHIDDFTRDGTKRIHYPEPLFTRISHVVITARPPNPAYWRKRTTKRGISAHVKKHSEPTARITSVKNCRGYRIINVGNSDYSYPRTRTGTARRVTGSESISKEIPPLFFKNLTRLNF